MTDNKDAITKLTEHPGISRYMGKAVKAVAGLAVLGCIVLWLAITALSNLITNALPH
ncbi:MAG: hypothetical protein JSS86_23170 [Cyanobacteria bacterium SZAS LIN-2]|nr:hypothetical protein [Cyanobacteria bacterium SZAS LIN-2]MBS2006483.1 hypothetical protein [Cyanobacteria bacterium SZAS TMP-1]